jgi:predicted Na+-dependent transporter
MIVAFLYIFALLEVGYGIGNIVGLKNEMLGALAIGFGILTAALAAILMEVEWSRALLQRLSRGL